MSILFLPNQEPIFVSMRVTPSSSVENACFRDLDGTLCMCLVRETLDTSEKGGTGQRMTIWTCPRAWQ